MCMIGEDGHEIKVSFEFRDGEEVMTTEIIFSKCEAHCKPKKSIRVLDTIKVESVSRI